MENLEKKILSKKQIEEVLKLLSSSVGLTEQDQKKLATVDLFVKEYEKKQMFLKQLQFDKVNINREEFIKKINSYIFEINKLIEEKSKILNDSLPINKGNHEIEVMKELILEVWKLRTDFEEEYKKYLDDYLDVSDEIKMLIDRCAENILTHNKVSVENDSFDNMEKINFDLIMEQVINELISLEQTDGLNGNKYNINIDKIDEIFSLLQNVNKEDLETLLKASNILCNSSRLSSAKELISHGYVDFRCYNSNSIWNFLPERLLIEYHNIRNVLEREFKTIFENDFKYLNIFYLSNLEENSFINVLVLLSAGIIEYNSSDMAKEISSTFLNDILHENDEDDINFFKKKKIDLTSPEKFCLSFDKYMSRAFKRKKLKNIHFIFKREKDNKFVNETDDVINISLEQLKEIFSGDNSIESNPYAKKVYDILVSGDSDILKKLILLEEEFKQLRKQFGNLESDFARTEEWKKFRNKYGRAYEIDGDLVKTVYERIVYAPVNNEQTPLISFYILKLVSDIMKCDYKDYENGIDLVQENANLNNIIKNYEEKFKLYQEKPLTELIEDKSKEEVNKIEKVYRCH